MHTIKELRKVIKFAQNEIKEYKAFIKDIEKRIKTLKKK